MINQPATQPLIVYIPAINASTYALLRRYRERVPETARQLVLAGNAAYQEVVGHKASIRALDAATVRDLLSATNEISRIDIVPSGPNEVLFWEAVNQATEKVWLSDDEFGRTIQARFLKDATAEFIPVFLRWDSANVLVEDDVRVDRVTREPFWVNLMSELQRRAQTSSDWWRQVGAGLVIRDQILYATNNHLPDEYAPYIDGDPRDEIPAGQRSEISTALHAEPCVMMQAANRGIATRGGSIGVTTFPCPACAKLFVPAGLSAVYFVSGHVSLGVDEMLHARNIEIVRVDMST